MKRATAVHRLPWALWALAVALVVAADALVIAQLLSPASPLFAAWPAATLNALTFATVGAVVALRRPGNPVGWLFLVIGVLSGVQLGTGEYAMYDRYVRHDALPGTAVSGWVCGVASVLVLGLMSFVLLLFPDGRFLSRQWRRFGQVAVLLTGVSVLALAVAPGELGLTAGIDNPFGLSSDSELADLVAGAPFELTIGAPVILCALVGVACLVVRWRRAGAEQRAQLKWVLFAAAAGFTAVVLSASLIPLVGEWANNMAWNVALAVIPVAAGASILRYRLYDIDHIVSRTVSYTVVTGLLVAVYAGLVTAVSRLIPENSKSLAVAASTLAVAALLQPLLRRVRAVVDRRFNRSRYDSARTVEAFSLRLREQVDLGALQADLLAVVHETMQPTSARLWLRGARAVA
ncbi:MAG: hypothetical protein M3P23_04205 [Actinomycetota bacterium]|nr:hypothetical protein [Actinomycetota bacterium]